MYTKGGYINITNIYNKKMDYKIIYKKIMTPFIRIRDKKYEESLQKKLKVSGFSIICSSCMGGVIYHRLGEKFLSPTVNLWINQKEFLKMVKDLKKYMKYDLIFINQTQYKFPVAKLNDIFIYFNHSKTNEEARELWNRRRERINYDNLYIIMYDRDGITKEEILSLQNVPCKNKVVFSDKSYPEIDYIKTIKPNLKKINGISLLDKDLFLRRTFEKKFDFVKWLNDGINN